MHASESAIFCGDCFGHLRIARGLDVKTNDGKFEIAKLMYVLTKIIRNCPAGIVKHDKLQVKIKSGKDSADRILVR